MGAGLRDAVSTYVNLIADVVLGEGCVEGERDMTIDYAISPYGWAYAFLQFHASSGYINGISGTVQTINQGGRAVVTFRAPSLVRLPGGVRCIDNIGLSSGDQVDGFCVGAGGCFQAPPAVDTTPPSVSWVTPREGQRIAGVLSESSATPTCLVNARDGSGIARTENYVDGQFNDAQVNPPYSCELDTRRLADGPHTLTVRALDPAGNVGESTITVIVDNTGPPPPVGPVPPPAPTPPVVVGPAPLGPSGALFVTKAQAKPSAQAQAR